MRLFLALLLIFIGIFIIAPLLWLGIASSNFLISGISILAYFGLLLLLKVK